VLESRIQRRTWTDVSSVRPGVDMHDEPVKVTAEPTFRPTVVYNLKTSGGIAYCLGPGVLLYCGHARQRLLGSWNRRIHRLPVLATSECAQDLAQVMRDAGLLVNREAPVGLQSGAFL